MRQQDRIALAVLGLQEIETHERYAIHVRLEFDFLLDADLRSTLDEMRHDLRAGLRESARELGLPREAAALLYKPDLRLALTEVQSGSLEFTTVILWGAGAAAALVVAVGTTVLGNLMTDALKKVIEKAEQRKFKRRPEKHPHLRRRTTRLIVERPNGDRKTVEVVEEVYGGAYGGDEAFLDEFDVHAMAIPAEMHGPPVFRARVGDRFKSRDKRDKGKPFRVVEITPTHVVMQREGQARRTRVSLDRLNERNYTRVAGKA